MSLSCSLLPKSPSISFPRKSRFFITTTVDIEIFGFPTFYSPSVFTFLPNMAPLIWLVVWAFYFYHSLHFLFYFFLAVQKNTGYKHGRTEILCVIGQSAAGRNKQHSHWCGFPRYPEFHKWGPRGPLSIPCLLQQTSLLVIRNSFDICIRDAYLYDCSAVIVNNLSAFKCTTNVPFYPWVVWKSPSLPLSPFLVLLLLLQAPFTLYL